MPDKRYDKFRYFLKDSIRQEVDFNMTDQMQGVPPPPVVKPPGEGKPGVHLRPPDEMIEIGEMGAIPLADAIRRRHSRRNYKDVPLEIDELSWLLWATQGIVREVGEGTAFRTVPSAGCRHAFETYLLVFNVKGLDEGIYRFLPDENMLWEVSRPERLGEKLHTATLGQDFTAHSAVTFAWTAIPRRMEWRYAEAAHKVIAIDIGHVCQNLYLAVEAIGCGTCAIGAYHQEGMDGLLGVDGDEEFTIYMASVGRV
jgi:SagB-type dehydrogenase family enzyme